VQLHSNREEKSDGSEFEKPARSKIALKQSVFKKIRDLFACRNSRKDERPIEKDAPNDGF
jgi:hypothetical protein